mmetsp:Transcript_2756/g.4257  ORF Transcript_2756/g.4257 Transcript_2756/m.4257 type:complete len:150 (-) Transcript_2756:79-528(-)
MKLFVFVFLLQAVLINSFSPLKSLSINRNKKIVRYATETPIKNEGVIILAQSHMKTLKKTDDALCLRMGVKSGGCSGMSYVMEIIKQEDITPEDHIEEYEGIKCVVDPKALLFLYGLNLDYSDELIGGGFKFSNPNAEKSCGCGKSFGV